MGIARAFQLPDQVRLCADSFGLVLPNVTSMALSDKTTPELCKILTPRGQLPAKCRSTGSTKSSGTPTILKLFRQYFMTISPFADPWATRSEDTKGSPNT